MECMPVIHNTPVTIEPIAFNLYSKMWIFPCSSGRCHLFETCLLLINEKTQYILTQRCPITLAAKLVVGVKFELFGLCTTAPSPPSAPSPLAPCSPKVRNEGRFGSWFRWYSSLLAASLSLCTLPTGILVFFLAEIEVSAASLSCIELWLQMPSVSLEAGMPNVRLFPAPKPILSYDTGFWVCGIKRVRDVTYHRNTTSIRVIQQIPPGTQTRGSVATTSPLNIIQPLRPPPIGIEIRGRKRGTEQIVHILAHAPIVQRTAGRGV